VNTGPGDAASLGEIILAGVFIVLVFGALIFAFAVPIIGFFSTHKERWHDYSTKKKIQVLRTTAITLSVIGLLIWLSSAPTSGAEL
jgi:Na+-driven multidrug efflux pump